MKRVLKHMAWVRATIVGGGLECLLVLPTQR